MPKKIPLEEFYDEDEDYPIPTDPDLSMPDFPFEEGDFAMLEGTEVFVHRIDASFIEDDCFRLRYCEVESGDVGTAYMTEAETHQIDKLDWEDDIKPLLSD